MELMIILGSPASGKTTLGRRLARELGAACLCKDDVKEALFDVLGAAGPEGVAHAPHGRPGMAAPELREAGTAQRNSALFSRASFAALVGLARTQLQAGVSCFVEGNFRPLHAPGIAAILALTGARAAQIWCQAEAGEMARRFAARRRHAGHEDEAVPADELSRWTVQPPTFLEVAGPRWSYRSDVPDAYAGLVRDLEGWRS